jgi:hypothetical protein
VVFLCLYPFGRVRERGKLMTRVKAVVGLGGRGLEMVGEWPGEEINSRNRRKLGTVGGWKGLYTQVGDSPPPPAAPILLCAPQSVHMRENLRASNSPASGGYLFHRREWP